MKLRAATIALVLSLTTATGLVACYVWLTGGEIQENRYDSNTDAQVSIDRGWLPSALPRSATQIHEWHNLDTNERFGSFRFDPGARAAFESGLQPGIPTTKRIDRDPSFARDLPLDPTEAQLLDAGFQFYAAQDFGFAINWNTGVAYVWSSSPLNGAHAP